ncbi:MAG: glycosyltransferase family 9 protein, partial [Methanosarcinaceae archaeon]
MKQKKGTWAFAKSLLRIVKELRKIGYDIVIDFEQFLRLSAIICLLTRGKERIGFATSHQCRNIAYAHTSYYSPFIHTFNNFIQLLSFLGIHCEPDTLEEIHVSRKDKAVVAEILHHVGISNTDLVVGIHTGSGGTGVSRRWGDDKFGYIIRRLITQYDAKIILTGTKEEKPFIDSIIDNTDSRNNVFNFAGMVTLGQLPFLIKNCRAFLTNDTGPMHIAAAMNVPTVALFGPNTPFRYGPVGNGHVVIYKKLECSPCIIAYEGKVPYCKDTISACK